MKKKKAPKTLQKVEYNVFVRVLSEAAYWTKMIGKIKTIVGGSKKNPTVRVEFVYALDGTRLKKPEVMDFALNRLYYATDFAARVRKHLPKPEPQTIEQEYEIWREATQPDPLPSVPQPVQEPPAPPTVLKSLADLPTPNIPAS